MQTNDCESRKVKDHFGESNKMVANLTKENEELKKELAALKAEVERLTRQLNEFPEAVKMLGNRDSLITLLSQERDAFREALEYIVIASRDTGQAAIQRYAKDQLTAYPKKEEK